MAKKLWWVLVLLVSLLLSACGGNQAEVAEILVDAAETMADVGSLQFTVEREGDPVLLDASLNASMLGAAGVYQAPGSVYAAVRVSAGGFVTDAEVIWQDEGAYFKLPPLLPDYQAIDLSATFDARNIFDEGVGLPAILRAFQSPKLIGQEDIDGVNAHHIRASADAEQFRNLVGGAVSEGEATLDVWIDTTSSEVVRAVITESSGGIWSIDFFAFGEPVEIPSP